MDAPSPSGGSNAATSLVTADPAEHIRRLQGLDASAELVPVQNRRGCMTLAEYKRGLKYKEMHALGTKNEAIELCNRDNKAGLFPLQWKNFGTVSTGYDYKLVGNVDDDPGNRAKKILEAEMSLKLQVQVSHKLTFKTRDILPVELIKPVADRMAADKHYENHDALITDLQKSFHQAKTVLDLIKPGAKLRPSTAR